ncbi:MAG: FAD-dependent thymidylate synthase, partial [Candidatus Anstonellales archaeon]
YSKNEFTEEEITLLQDFISNVNGNVFALMNMPEIVKAALFSRYSRSNKSLKRILLDEFINEGLLKGPDKECKGHSYINVKKAEDFFDRVFIGYGDDSVAELAFAHIAVENCSSLMAKILEDSRVGISPLEKSTRYVAFDEKVNGKYKYYEDQTIMKNYGDLYNSLMQKLFDTYAEMLYSIKNYLRKRYKKEEHISERAYENAIKAKACDITRGLLPASTLTNVGLAGNARAFEYLLIKMAASELYEAKSLADEMYNELKKVLPSLIKRFKSSYGEKHISFLSQLNEAIENLALAYKNMAHFNDNDEDVKLIHVNGREEDVFASLLFMKSGLDFEKAIAHARQMSSLQKSQFLLDYERARDNRRHKPNRAFELVSYTFQITCNFGAYRDLQRHRLNTQFRQLLTTHLGYDTPEEIIDAGLKQKWDDAMHMADDIFRKIEKKSPYNAQYVVPFAYKIRWLLSLNLREALHMCELRSSEQGHADYRKIAIKIADKIKQVHPIIGRFKFLNNASINLERLNAEIKREKQTIKNGQA